MYTREKPSRQESHKSRKNNNIPSFSSTLLDEIYRSIDEKTEDFKAYTDKTSKRNEEIASACLVEKWMEKEAISKRKPTTLLQMQDFDNDFMFFSSTSSSNSDSSGALSSSDTEFFGSSTTNPKSSSCFSARLKPIKTGGARNHQTVKDRGTFLSDDYGNGKMVEDVIKSKSRALKIYANLKKKQPISPGGKLTNFINSLFSSNAANGKKSKGFEDSKSRKGPSTCSSASSFSRSCLSKYSPNSREKMRNGDQRTVRFHPVSVMVDQDSRPCGQKCTYDQDPEKLHLSPPVSKTETKQSKMQGNRKVDHIQESGLGLKGYNGKRVDKFSVFRKIHDHENENEDEDDAEDCMSDASSDLFELDHLSLFGDKRFCEELPVYETTRFDTNRAIASGLIR